MGCFDSVYFGCPDRQCIGLVEFQSKAGGCDLEVFQPECVPLSIAGDIEGDVEMCPECGTSLKVRLLQSTGTVAMTVERDNDR